MFSLARYGRYDNKTDHIWHNLHIFGSSLPSKSGFLYVVKTCIIFGWRQKLSLRLFFRFYNLQTHSATYVDVAFEGEIVTQGEKM